MTGARAQEFQDAFEVASARFWGERSTDVDTTLFDLPAKVVLGNYCGHDVIPGLVTELEARISAAEMGRRRRALGVPLALDLTGLLWIYLLGRLQRFLDAGWPDAAVDLGDDEDAARVIRYWHEMTRAYRDDGTIVPGPAPAEAVLRCLDEAEVERIAAAARERGAPEDPMRMRRALAQIELYIFLAHGEQRDGNFHHGPYPLPDGTILVVKELTDLRNRFMPWITEERRLPTSRIVLPMIFRDVEAQFDMFGTLYTEPKDAFDRIVGFEILAGEDLEPISEELLERIAGVSQEVQRDLFREMAGWDERYRLFHAAFQYANVLYPYLELAGCDDAEIDRLLVAPFVEAAERNFALVHEHGGKVWTRIASGEQPLYAPVRA
jgi:hypothetical protein